MPPAWSVYEKDWVPHVRRAARSGVEAAGRVSARTGAPQAGTGPRPAYVPRRSRGGTEALVDLARSGDRGRCGVPRPVRALALPTRTTGSGTHRLCARAGAG